MAAAVKKAIDDNQHLVVEAGTGVGKSFAYLIPAINSVKKGEGRVLISTFTITLQEQLINKDIPFLADCLPDNFTAVLAKGRGNYLCKRRLNFVIKKQKMLFNKFSSELLAINQWAAKTQDGSLSDIGFIPKSIVWEKVNSEHGNCRGRNCPHFKDCFYQRARRRLESADIIVANHALMFSDLVLKEQNVSLLPDYNFVIIDEAHNIEHVAENHFGIDISNRQIKFLLESLYNPKTNKGMLAYIKAGGLIDAVEKTSKEAARFFKNVSLWYENTKEKTGGRCTKGDIQDNITLPVKSMASQLSKLANSTEDLDEKLEIVRFVNRCASLVQQLDYFLKQKKDNCVYWVEPKASRKANLHLRSAPINVGEDMKRTLFEKFKSIVMTSATLSITSADHKDNFSFFAGRIGLTSFEAVKLGSPFDYSTQVTVYIEKDLPNPNEPAFIETAAEAIKKYVLQTQGRAFVLFTSYSMLEKIAESLTNWFEENDFELLCQGTGLDRTILLKKFKALRTSVLFGTDSFWQGVDVPGETLGNVIIVKLPFAVPDQPLLAGRLEQIKQQGGNPFYDYQLPSAVIKFKQGFGRLIRNKTDTGIIAVLDSRIVRKRYGQMFLSSIPECKIHIVDNKE